MLASDAAWCGFHAARTIGLVARHVGAVALPRAKNGGKKKSGGTTTTRVVYKQAKRARRRGRRGGVGVNLLHVGLAAAALGYVGTNTDMGAKIAAKIPGNKTFGAGAALGITCLVMNMVKPNRYLKLAGIAGVVLAGTQIGVKGRNMAWVGGEEAGRLGGFSSVDNDYVAGYEEDDEDDY